MKNRYEIRGDITAIYVTYKGSVLETLIDTSDLPIADSFTGTWFASCAKSNKKYYVYGIPRDNQGKQFTLRLHRHLVGCPKGLQVDHINRDTLDNRRSNLRTVTPAQNRQNLGVYSNNKSGYRGVYWHQRDQVWCAVVRHKGKDTQVGRFQNINDAAVAVENARKRILPFSSN